MKTNYYCHKVIHSESDLGTLTYFYLSLFILKYINKNMRWFLDPSLQRISDFEYLSHFRITSFFCLIFLVFNTKFRVLHTVFEPAMYNIHNAEKSIRYIGVPGYMSKYKGSWMFCLTSRVFINQRSYQDSSVCGCCKYYKNLLK